MSKAQPLWHRLHYDPLLTELARRVGYVGFPVHQLAEKLRDLAKQHGARKLSAALLETMSLVGNRVMLNEATRRLCWQLLGPPPEKWDSFYRNPDGSPTPRPPGKESPPVIPEREIDPITDGLRALTVTQLDSMLRQAWANRTSAKQHVADLAREQIPRIESELLRRGEEIPEEPSPEPTTEEPPPPAKKPTRTKKKAP